MHLTNKFQLVGSPKKELTEIARKVLDNLNSGVLKTELKEQVYMGIHIKPTNEETTNTK
jgi:hypothetical protein